MPHLSTKDTTMTQLLPLKVSRTLLGGTVYFHDPATDLLYKLKDPVMQSRCNFFGLWREIELEEDALLPQGTLGQFKQRRPGMYVFALDRKIEEKST